MDADIVLDVVHHLDKYGVVLPSIYSWTREPSIDCNNGLA